MSFQRLRKHTADDLSHVIRCERHEKNTQIPADIVSAGFLLFREDREANTEVFASEQAATSFAYLLFDLRKNLINDIEKNLYIHGGYMEQQPWLLNYPEGVSNVSISPTETLTDLLSESARTYAGKTFLNFFGKKISYKKFLALCDRFAYGLVRFGVSSGDRVGLCVPNCPEAVIAYFAILRIGAIVVPCNPLYTERELTHQLRDAGVCAVVVWDDVYEKVTPIKSISRIIITRMSDFMTLPVRTVYRWKKKTQKLVIKKSPRVAFFRDMLKNSPIPQGLLPCILPGDTAMLQYTGGTTGTAKGAELSHRNLIAQTRSLSSWFSGAEKGREVFLAALPLFHIFGLTVTQNTCMALGGEMMLLPDPRDIKRLASAIRRRATVVCLVPKLYQALVSHLSRTDSASVKFFISGGASLPAKLFEQFRERTGHFIIEGYGLTEAAPVTHCNIPALPRKRSIGLPIPSTEARIDAESGELLVRGPQIMKGYWRNFGETRAVLTPDGWLRTGDIAQMDADGFFSIIDRKKDMILSLSGFNVYPSEVESILMSHPAVAEVAVIGIPVAGGGELVKAFVVCAPGYGYEGRPGCSAELMEYCRKNLAPYKVPKAIEFRSSLPYSTVGKVLRRALREEGDPSHI